MKCHVCGKRFQKEGRECGRCGAVVRSILGDGGPIPEEAARQLRWKKQHPTIVVRRRRFRRVLGNALAGAIVFVLAMVVVAFLSLLHNLGGLAERATRPATIRELTGGIWHVAAYTGLIGVPMGVLLGWLRWGFVLGGIVGAVTFLACYFLAGFDGVFEKMNHALVPPLLPILGFLTGSLVAFHARMKRS
jgi:hypothetical protein